MITSILTALLAGATVTFPMEARVRGTEITLGEIATIATDDDAERARLEGVHLGYAPMPGFSRLFHATRVAEVIERSTGIRVALSGDRACRVWPVTREIAPEEFAAAASAELGRISTEADVEFHLRGDHNKRVEVPAGLENIQLEARLPDNALRGGTMSVPVGILIDGELYRTVWTSFDVVIYENRTVLARDVRAGERLGPELFAQKRIRVPRPGAANPGRQMVVGAVATRDLSRDDFVTELDVRRPIAVRRGETIYLQATKGAVQARVPAIAHEDGAVGDRIFVETIANGRRISAVVRSQDLAEIDLGTIGGRR